MPQCEKVSAMMRAPMITRVSTSSLLPPTSLFMSHQLCVNDDTHALDDDGRRGNLNPSSSLLCMNNVVSCNIDDCLNTNDSIEVSNLKQNERTNERSNERANERMSERMNVKNVVRNSTLNVHDESCVNGENGMGSNDIDDESVDRH